MRFPAVARPEPAGSAVGAALVPVVLGHAVVFALDGNLIGLIASPEALGRMRVDLDLLLVLDVGAPLEEGLSDHLYARLHALGGRPALVVFALGLAFVAAAVLGERLARGRLPPGLGDS